MNDIIKLTNLLPPILPMNLKEIKGHKIYIGAAGFEDRSLAILNEALKTRWNFDQAIIINYKPFDKRNRNKEFQNKLNYLGIPSIKQKWIVYDRYDPESFSFPHTFLRERLKPESCILIDISAMSKFLIVVLLQELQNLQASVEIVYAEAEHYYPIKEKFEAEKAKLPRATPDFLTTDVYKIVTASSLSSVAMQGYPIIMVAFQTFNHRDIMALLNEIMPQQLISFEEKPHEEHNEWRLEAIRWVNRKVEEYITTKTHILSTFNYTDTVNNLEQIYIDFCDTHKMVVAPTGSKLQTVAVFLFKQIHPDVQLIYPVTRKFTEKYTQGYKALWRIPFPEFAGFLGKLDSYRKHSLQKLKSAIDTLANTGIGNL